MLVKTSSVREYNVVGYRFCAAGFAVDWGNSTDELVLGKHLKYYVTYVKIIRSYYESITFYGLVQ